MIDLLLVLMVILLFTATMALRRMANVDERDLELAAVLREEPAVHVQVKRRPRVWSTALLRAATGLSRIPKWVAHGLLLGGIGSGAYVLIAGHKWIAVGIALAAVLPWICRLLLNPQYRVVFHSLPFGLPTEFRYTGRATLPSSVYAGDSYNFAISLERKFRETGGDVGSTSVRIREKASGKSISIKFAAGPAREYLEIELLAAGVTVDGDKRQRQLLSSERLNYMWSLYFPNSGNHMLAFVLRVAGEAETIEIGTTQHKIRVARLDHLTQRQVWVLATVAGVMTGGLAFAEALRRLGIW